MFYKFIKRLFDIVVSALALIITAILFIIAFVGIKVSSPGSVFYTSNRIGRNGKAFTMYKFRSMHIKQKDAVENSYLVNTQRIFAFGAFLRKSKIDELPQLINVFLGHMSIVGPRPYPQSVVNRLYTGEYEKVLSVRPGLACLDSLYDYAHGDLFVTDAEQYKEQVIPVRTELARLYIDKKSFGVDIHCIFRTIKLVFEILVLKKKEFVLTKFEEEAVERIKKNKTEKIQEVEV